MSHIIFPRHNMDSLILKYTNLATTFCRGNALVSYYKTTICLHLNESHYSLFLGLKSSDVGLAFTQNCLLSYAENALLWCLEVLNDGTKC